MGSKNSPIPRELESVRRRLERWRSQRRAGDRMPEGLWASAAKVASRHGIYRTSHALHLDYVVLKKRVEASGCEPPERPATAAFVEVAGSGSLGCAECVVELEAPDGAKMRIHLKGTTLPDVTTLTRSFWSSEAEA